MAQAQRVRDLPPPAAAPAPRASAARPTLSPIPIAPPREQSLADVLDVNPLRLVLGAGRFLAVGLVVAGLVIILWSL